MPYSLPPTPLMRAQSQVVQDPNTVTPGSIPENFVSYTLKQQKPLPPITWENWYTQLIPLTVFTLLVPPILCFIGLWYVPIMWKTAVWSTFYGHLTGLGISAGYHRLWTHRSYKASKSLEYFLAILGTAIVQGSISWWARRHRAHHRYTDTELDPYNILKGFLYAHIGWILLKPRIRSPPIDDSDLRSNPIVTWQHKYYLPLALLTAVIIPTCVAGYGWGDWRGGFLYSGLGRLVITQHCTFSVNSLCHWIGDRPYDDKRTPRDFILAAFVTMGEGYHNFHHQFPTDYRNGHKWYHYDPSKWFLWTCAKLGFATHLKTFSDNEVQKAELTMQLKHLRQKQESLSWPCEKQDLPVITWGDYQREAEDRALICIGGYIHDVTDFFDEHPGGPHLLKKNIGKDATAAFFGGLYEHSNAAHNLLAMKRVSILLGGVPHGSEEQFIPPSQHLRVARFDELSTET